MKKVLLTLLLALALPVAAAEAQNIALGERVPEVKAVSYTHLTLPTNSRV